MLQPDIPHMHLSDRFVCVMPAFAAAGGCVACTGSPLRQPCAALQPFQRHPNNNTSGSMWPQGFCALAAPCGLYIGLPIYLQAAQQGRICNQDKNSAP